MYIHTYTCVYIYIYIHTHMYNLRFVHAARPPHARDGADVLVALVDVHLY